MSLWATKSIAALRAEAERPGSTALRAHPRSASNLVFLGIGAIIGAGIFVLTGQAAALHAGPGGADLDGHRGHRLHLRRALLRRDGEHGAGGGQRLHLLVRHHGRAGRLDHRLGPGARVRHGRRHGGGGLVGPPREPARHLRHPHSRGARQRAVPVVHRRRTCRRRWRAARTRAGTPPARSSTCRRCSSSVADDDRPGHRHQGVGQRQQPDRHPQGHDHPAHRGLSASCTSTRPTGSRSSRPTPAPGASSAGRACCAAPGWSSSPTSGSTP